MLTAHTELSRYFNVKSRRVVFFLKRGHGILLYRELVEADRGCKDGVTEDRNSDESSEEQLPSA